MVPWDGKVYAGMIRGAYNKRALFRIKQSYLDNWDRLSLPPIKTKTIIATDNIRAVEHFTII